MPVRAVVFVLCTLSAACSRSDTTAKDTASADSGRSDSASAALTVDPHGIGFVRIGMSVQQLSEAAQEKIRPKYEINETCDFVALKTLPKGVAFMILEDTVARVDVDTTGILTSEGAGVGDLESRIIALYGQRAHVEPHKYTGPQGHYVIVETPGDTLHRIIFETDGQRVERYRAGRRPGVDFIEGCA